MWFVLCVLGGSYEETLLKSDNRTWSTGSLFERGRCSWTSLPLFTVYFLSACTLFFNAIPHPLPGFHRLLLSPRQVLDGKSDQSSWNEGVCCTIWEEMKSFCYCEETASSTNAAWRCASSIFLTVKQLPLLTLSPEQLINLHIQWLTVEHCPLAHTQGRWKLVTLLLRPYNYNLPPVNGVTLR